MSFFVKKIKEYLEEPKSLFALIFIFLLILRIIYIILPTTMWWDASVYIGMARYISSFGANGLWEYFRPPLLPILFSIGGFLHIGIIFWAKLLTFFASIGSLFLIYKIGERLRPYTGVFASLTLGISTLFFSFTNVPMTEVLGVFLSIVALYAFLFKKNPIILGIIVGLCFLLRFPYGILFPLFGLLLFISKIFDRADYKNPFIYAIKYFFGFLIIIGPYLLLNKVLYGGFFTPFIVGQEMIKGSLWLYSHPTWFYIKILFIDNPLFLLFPIAFLYLSKDKLSLLRKAFLWLVIFWALSFMTYFTYQIHKEARYIIPVVPALALLAGLSLSYMYERIQKSFFFVLIIGITIFTFFHTNIYIASKNESRITKEFYNFLATQNNKIVITASPIVTAYSPVRIIDAYDSWKNFNYVYEKERLNSDFLLINTCELHVCTPGNEKECNEDKVKTLSFLEKNESLLYDKSINSCRLIIYKINK